jgi:adenine phosphoribosyltransferase
MGKARQVETLSITTGSPQLLVLDEKDSQLIRGKRVVIVDDVISTGSTLEAMRKLMNDAGASVVAEAAICTEGENAAWDKVIHIGELPLFCD